MRFVAGVDTHKDSHTIAILNAAGEVVQELAIPATEAGFAQAIAMAQAFSELMWGMEGTGCYGRGFAAALVAVGYIVYEVPGSFTKRYRKHASRPGKSDALDARAIAEVILRESGRLSRFEQSDEQEAIRLQYDRRNRYVRLRTEAVNRLRAAALRLMLGSLPKNLTTEKALATVEEALRTLAVIDYTTRALVDDANDAIDEIRVLNDKITVVERKLRPFVSKLAPELLAMRGISVVVAAGLIGHAGNIAQYRDSSAFAMRTGTAPIPCSSGRTSALRVNPGGDRQLNRCLHTVALSQAHAPGHPGKAYYERKRAEGKDHLAALRALKRQLATIVFYRLREAATRFARPNLIAQAA